MKNLKQKILGAGVLLFAVTAALPVQARYTVVELSETLPYMRIRKDAAKGWQIQGLDQQNKPTTAEENFSADKVFYSSGFFGSWNEWQSHSQAKHLIPLEMEEKEHKYRVAADKKARTVVFEARAAFRLPRAMAEISGQRSIVDLNFMKSLDPKPKYAVISQEPLTVKIDRTYAITGINLLDSDMTYFNIINSFDGRVFQEFPETKTQIDGINFVEGSRPAAGIYWWMQSLIVKNYMQREHCRKSNKPEFHPRCENGSDVLRFGVIFTSFHPIAPKETIVTVHFVMAMSNHILPMLPALKGQLAEQREARGEKVETATGAPQKKLSDEEIRQKLAIAKAAREKKANSDNVSLEDGFALFSQFLIRNMANSLKTR